MSNNYKKDINIGLILTRLNYKYAYYKNKKLNHPPMSKFEEYEARRELREGFRQLTRCVDKPHIVLAPELSAPQGFLYEELKKHTCGLGAITIFGGDYLLDYSGSERNAKNHIVITIPDRWPHKSYRTNQFSIFKSYPSWTEKEELIKRDWHFYSDHRLWIFDAGPYGIFGVANCYDFLDIEMHLLYMAKIHHLFVLSYNKDVASFRYTAESLSRTLYCNVVICNTGYFGGSVCISPYKKPYQRLIYNTEGNNLFSAQIIKLPVKIIIDKRNNPEKYRDLLKDLPPSKEFSPL